MPDKKNSQNSRVTSKDVAALAGVSQSTVSRVLNPKSEAGNFISEETANRVRKAANQLGYSPNPIAQALRGQPTNLIGLVVREITDPFFAGVIEVLGTKVRQAGMNMILGHAHSDPDEALEMTRVLDSRQCDGFILLGDLHNDQVAVEKIISENHPVVALCRGKTPADLPTINVNNRKGIHLLVDHLIGLGHTNLIFIDGGWFGDIHERRTEFLKYLKGKKGIEYSWFQAKDNSATGGYDAMKEIGKFQIIPSAILASDDAMASGILKAASEIGLSIPGDISATGFDDTDCASFLIPGLTTIRQPIEKMAELALEMLISQINGNVLPRGKNYIQVEPGLIVRESTGHKK